MRAKIYIFDKSNLLYKNRKKDIRDIEFEDFDERSKMIIIKNNFIFFRDDYKNMKVIKNNFGKLIGKLK